VLREPVLSNMRSFPFELLKNRIDLETVPFTERESRFLLFHSRRQFRLSLTEYETPLEDTKFIYDWCFMDSHGTPLLCDITSYPDRLECQTMAGLFQIAFVDAETLMVVLPAGGCGMCFTTRAAPSTVHSHGGKVCLQVGRSLELSYQSSTKLIRNEIVPNETTPVDSSQRVTLGLQAQRGDYLLFNLSEKGITAATPDAVTVLRAATQRWQEWFDKVPKVLDDLQFQYYFAWWVMGVNLIRPRLCSHYIAMVPSKLGYMGVWHWDSYFHAIGLGHRDIKLAKDQFRILLNYQLENGMIPDVIHDTGVLAFSTDMVPQDIANSLSYVGQQSAEAAEMMQAPITKPPLTAWAAWKVYLIDKDRDFLAAIYRPIVRWQEWWIRDNDLDQNGLPEFQHPYSSGIDDSPLWDQGPPLESPDLGSYLCLQYVYLARMAAVLDLNDDAEQWKLKARQLAQRLIEVQWDKKSGFFRATKQGQKIETRTPFNLYPLITGHMPQDIADELVANLTNQRLFWSQYPVPTVAFDDPHFNPERMWRGPVWLNPNYLLIDGLFRAGYPEIARELRRRTLSLVTATPNAMNEYYHPITGEKPPRATVMFGWTAALFIDLCIAETLES
jgi:putative isomerase